MSRRGPNGTVSMRRLRLRLAMAGARALSDAELLALVLGSGGQCATDGPLGLAAGLLERAGGLDALLGLEPAALAGLEGVGPALAARVRAARELGRRFLATPPARFEALTRPADAARCLVARLGDLPHEEFGCLFLDARHGLIGFESLFRGTIDGATVYPREVVKRALSLNAAAVIAGHNHPSGCLEPSEADRSITAKLSQALGLVDIRLLDHLVVSRYGHTSLAEKGWL